MIALPDTLRPPPLGGSAEADTVALERFCAALLDVLRAGDSGRVRLAPVILDLVRGLRASSQATVSQLRREMAAWDEAATGLRQLVRSPFLQVGTEAGTLLDRLEQARAQADQIIAALEGLPDAPTFPSDTPRADSGREELLLLGTEDLPASRPVSAAETVTMSAAQDTTVVIERRSSAPETAAPVPKTAEKQEATALRVPPPADPPEVRQPRRKEPRPAAAAPAAPARTSTPKPIPAPSRSKQSPPTSTMTVACPACSQPSKLRWDRLQAGKVLSCPHCRKNLTALPGGRLAEVVKDRRGRWVERGQQQAQTRLSWARRSHLAGASLAVFVIVLAVVGTRKLMSRPAAGPAPLPSGLEQRAELFGRAWLKGDTFLMRRLTDPVHDRQLFPWNKRHAPPALPGAADGKIAVEVLPGSSPTWVRVRFDGLSGASSTAPLLLQTAWEKRGDTWVFSPRD